MIALVENFSCETPGCPKKNKKGLLAITQHPGRDPDDKRLGYRNERNSFDISPFVGLIQQAYKIRKRDRDKTRKEGASES